MLVAALASVAPAPRAVVILAQGTWPDGLGRLEEALQVYLREFQAVVRAVPGNPAAELDAIRAGRDTDFAVLLSVADTPGHLRIVITDLRGEFPRQQSSEVAVPVGVNDPSRHVALLVRAEVAAAARLPPPPPPPIPMVTAAVPPASMPTALAATASAFAAATADRHVTAGVVVVVGARRGARFLGGLLELGRAGAQVGALGSSETTVVAAGVDVRPGRLLARGGWSLFWGGQVGGQWARTTLVPVGSGARLRLADTFAPFLRGGVTSWHRLGRRLALTWDAGVEVLPLATEVRAGPERAFASGHLRPRLGLGLGFQR